MKFWLYLVHTFKRQVQRALMSNAKICSIKSNIKIYVYYQEIVNQEWVKIKNNKKYILVANKYSNHDNI